jgi:hypothetical protein
MKPSVTLLNTRENEIIPGFTEHFNTDSYFANKVLPACYLTSYAGKLPAFADMLPVCY